MAVRQINTSDFDYSMMLESINKSYKGKADITLSNFDTTAAPDVKVGSVFEDNGAIFILESADLTPTGYAGMTNSTVFYLYYDESGEVFIYSNTAPTWSDALQGWYTGNDRAFFSMYKDSGGTLYENKSLMINQSELNPSGSFKGVPAFGDIGTITAAVSSDWVDETHYAAGTEWDGTNLLVSNNNPIDGSPFGGDTSDNLIVVGARSTSAGLTGTWILLHRIYAAKFASTSSRALALFQRIR